MALQGLTVQKWDIAFAIYVTAGVMIDVALLYCTMQGMENLTFCREVLELRYLAEPVQCINSILAGTDHWRHLKCYVDEWLIEHRLMQWITTMNEDSGIAPSFECVFSHYATLCTNPSKLQFRYQNAVDRRKWVKRFMHKWESFRGSIPSHEAENRDDVVTKVCQKPYKSVVFLSFFGPHFVNQFGADFGAFIINLLHTPS